VATKEILRNHNKHEYNARRKKFDPRGHGSCYWHMCEEMVGKSELPYNIGNKGKY
jgi:hypothetical protein